MKDPYDREISVVCEKPDFFRVSIEDVETFSVFVNKSGLWSFGPLDNPLLSSAMVGEAPMTEEGDLFLSYVNEIREKINALL